MLDIFYLGLSRHLECLTPSRLRSSLNFELEKDTLRLSWRDLNTQTAGIDAGLAGVKGE